MSKWKRLQVPPIRERIIGFSIPQEDEVLVISYGGTHLLRLGNVITVETDDKYAEYDIYNPESGTARYRGKSYRIIGLHGGNPILKSLAGERLVLDTKLETLSVVINSQTEFFMKYNNYSGDWAAATFSTDNRYIVLGCPYDFDFVLLERKDDV